MGPKVSFGVSEGGRDPLSDEKDVMRSLNKHVDHCDTCYTSLSSWRSGHPLCSRGHSYVVDMQPYFFCKGGKPYSLIDRQQKNEYNRILVPAEYRYVSKLFEALSAGYSTNSSRPSRRPKVVVHQSEPEVYYTESRRQEHPTIVVPASPYASSRVSPRVEERYVEERHYREPRSRGSLYYEDERRRNRHGEEVIYTSSPRSPRYHL